MLDKKIIISLSFYKKRKLKAIQIKIFKDKLNIVNDNHYQDLKIFLFNKKKLSLKNLISKEFNKNSKIEN